MTVIVNTTHFRWQMLQNITVQWHTNNLKEIAQLHNESQIYAYSLVYPPHVVN